MLNKIILLDGYRKLERHVKKLITKAEKSFSDKRDYILFNAYLITATDYKKSIWQIDPSVQLLLLEPHRFWLSPKLENVDFSEIEQKRDIIRFMIVNDLELFLANNSKFHNDNLKEFINSQKQLIGKKLTETPSEIFNHNLDFTNDRSSNAKLETVKTICSISFGISLGAFIATKAHTLGWNYVYSILEKANVEYQNLGYFTRKAAGRMVKEFSILIGILAGWGNYKFFGNAFTSLTHDNKSDWKKLSVIEFIELCRGESETANLIFKEQNIDFFWLRKSHLSDLGGKSAIMLRTYIHQELARLQEEMNAKEFTTLLSCSVNEIPPPLKDVPYSVPIDFLRKPESWTSNTTLSTKECHNLLQQYISLAIIDYLQGQIIAQKKLNSREEKMVQAFMTRKSEQIKSTLNHLNSLSLKNKTNIFEYIPTGLIELIIAFIGSSLLFHYKISNLPVLDKQIEEVGSTISRILLNVCLALGDQMLRSPLIGPIITQGLITFIEKAIRQYSFYKEKKIAVTTDFFIQNTVKKSPELKAIFDDPSIDNNLEGGKKLN